MSEAHPKREGSGRRSAPGREPRRTIACAIALIVAALTVWVPSASSQLPAQGTERHGDLEFPRDEHMHIDGWDFWWGAADLLTRSGRRYTAELDPGFTVNGVGTSAHLLWPWQGPYRGRTIETEYGTKYEPYGEYVRDMSAYVPGVSDLLRLDTVEVPSGASITGSWRRTSLRDHSYRLLIDEKDARVHPTGERVRWRMDLRVTMQSPPLLVGGTGRWWYGVPQGFGYPSRSFQYSQVARRIQGTLEIEMPDGRMLREVVEPRGSSVLMTHEYDASPEDLPAGLAMSFANELHPRYAQYYQGGMPWELIFADLGNGAQLFVAVLVFQDADPGTLQPVIGRNMPGYKAMATIRLPSGRSIPLSEEQGLKVEHLSYRTMVGKVPTFLLYIDGIWKMAWTFRVSYKGSGSVPAFDLGFVPRFRRDEPALDEQGDAERQRLPFVISGAYDGCPVNGFGWSEVIVNWYHYRRDPWFTGRALPRTPARCE